MDIPLPQLILYLLPVILLHFGLAAYCIVDIIKNGVKNLSKPWWIVITLFVQIIGSVLYLTFGKKGYEV